MKYKSKIGLWAHIVCILLSLLPIWLLVDIICEITGATDLWVGLVITLPLAIFIVLPGYLSTYYMLEENRLFTRCGLFKYAIDYKDIISIHESKNPISSFALSLDRVKINYTNGNRKSTYMLVSPKNKQEFMRKLNERIGK